jgi:hypothetical protein
VSLNDPPETRWAEIQAYYAVPIRALVQEYCKKYPTLMLEALTYILDKNYFDAEIQAELRTLARVTNITYAQAAFLNYIYEYHAYCTSVIVRTTDGTIIHGRNLDYNFQDNIRESTADVEVYKDGKLLYHTIMWTWYMGVHTGFKPGMFSVSLNEKNSGSWLYNIGSILAGYQGNCLAVRNALSLNTFEEALEYLIQVKTVAPCYDILASPSTGSIITRNRASTLKVIGLEDVGGWYLVQTNHDWWTPDPRGDNRTEVAESFLNQVGQEGFTTDTMFELLSQVNVLNDYTIFTTIMVPETGEYSVVIRE